MKKIDPNKITEEEKAAQIEAMWQKHEDNKKSNREFEEEIYSDWIDSDPEVVDYLWPDD
tara:strand:- start:1192 stop:1368 length:177 start_codon:yes stop_codon:yes gene_type:complete